MPILNTPDAGAFRKDGKNRYYKIGDLPEMLSVTSALSMGLPKPALIGWAAKMSALAGLHHPERVAALVDVEVRYNEKGVPTAPQEAVDLYRFLTGYRFASRDAAADQGTAVHKLAEQTILSGEDQDASHLAEDGQRMYGHFLHFVAEVKPVWEAAECIVYSTTHRYAGTLDVIAELWIKELPQRILIDIKTGKGVYDDVSLQLSAYRYAERLAIKADGIQMDMPQTDGAAVLHLRPEGWRLVPVVTGPETFEVFLSVLRTARWSLESAKSAVGAAAKTGAAE